MKKLYLKNLEDEKLQFDFISFIRFPLMVGVVFIHAWIFKVNGTDLFDYHYFHGTPIVSNSIYPIYTVFAHIFSQIIPRISVPLFFFISGFLFFLKSDSFSFSQYKQKIHRRVRSILIPYIIWNLLAVFFYIVKKNMAGESCDLALTDWILAFWNFKGMYTPACLPFWFIRDLMVLFILSPIIYKAIKVLRVYALLILTGCWLSLFWVHLFELNCISVYFFTLGAYASINHVNFIYIAHQCSLWCKVIFLLSGFGILFSMQYDWSVYLLNINILAGLICCIDLVSSLIRANKCKVNHFLESSTFFVFAFHIILLDILVNWVGKIAIPQSDLALILVYIAIPTFTVLTCLFVFYFLQKFFPRMTAVITGGR